MTGSAYHKHLVRLMLQELRAGEPAPEYGRRISAFVLMLALHAGVMFLLLVNAPSGAPAEMVAAEHDRVQVRLISAEKSAPPPPPIELPSRPPVPEADRPQAPSPTRVAPQLALPQVPLPAVTPPVLTTAPGKLDLATAKPTPPPAASPVRATDADAAPPVVLAGAVPKVVLEPSAMAVPPPSIPATEPVPAAVAVARLAAVPSHQVAPRITPGKTRVRVKTNVARPLMTAPGTVTATLPEVTTAHAQAQVEIQLTASAQRAQVQPQQAAPAPSVVLETPDLPTVTLAQGPDWIHAPTLRLPPAKRTAGVTVASPLAAPRVSVQADGLNPAAAASAVAPAAATSRLAAAHPATASAAESWAPANDRFQALPGQRSAAAESGTTAQQAPGTVQLQPRGNSDVMTRNSDHLGYKPTIFEQYWAPANESLLDTMLRRFIEKLTVKHTFHVAPGVRVHCVLGPVAVFLACGGDPPRQASRLEGDARLNMAPARSLVPVVPSSVAASPPSSFRLDQTAQCATARVAGAPLPPGCEGAPVPPSQSDQWQPAPPAGG